MADPRVEALKAALPRFVAAGVDYNDAQRTLARIESWGEWCREWCHLAQEHEAQGEEAWGKGRAVSASAAFLRAAQGYHFAKYLFFHDQEQYEAALERSVVCYSKAIALGHPYIERVGIPFEGGHLPGYLARPLGSNRPPIVILLGGLDASKEELHAFSEVFLKRGIATLRFDGPGQGETGLVLKIRADYDRVVTAACDFLSRQQGLASAALAVVGQSLGGYYAPRAAAFEPRIKAAVAICGPFDWADCWEQLPPLTKAAYVHNSGAHNEAEAFQLARGLSLKEEAHRITCPLLVIHARRDTLIPPSEGERLAAAAGGPTELVIYEEAMHVCHNISYRYRPFVADWVKEALKV